MLQVYTYRECITKYQLVDFSAAPSVLNQTSEEKFEAHFFIFCWSEGEGGGVQNSFSKPAVWKILMTVLLWFIEISQTWCLLTLHISSREAEVPCSALAMGNMTLHLLRIAPIEIL